MDFLYIFFFNNTVLDYIIFLACIITGFLAVRLLSRFLLGHFIKKTDKPESTLENVITVMVKKRLVPIAYLTILYLSAKTLFLPAAVSGVLYTLLLAFIAVLGALFVSSLLVSLFNTYWRRKNAGEGHEMAPKLIEFFIKALIWLIILFLFLDNLGIKVNSLIAGLGIGGIAIAFAAQAILADIFCYFTILFDRPFEIGDYIEAGEHTGTVEHIGIKTTRLRALSGEQLIFSNTDLTNSRIKNYKTMEQRRVVFSLSVTYGTAYQKLTEIPDMIKGIIENTPDTLFSRAHLAALGTYSIDFNIVYYVLSGDYTKYMDIQQDVLLKIISAFENIGIKIAYPTQSLVISGTDARKQNDIAQ